MYEDKTLVCRIAVRNLHSQPVNRNFTLKRVLKMNLSVVRNVVRQERTVCVKTRRCMK